MHKGTRSLCVNWTMECSANPNSIYDAKPIPFGSMLLILDPPRTGGFALQVHSQRVDSTCGRFPQVT